MKSLVVLAASALLSLGGTACGGASGGASSTSRTVNASGATQSDRSFLGDGDADNPEDTDGDATDRYNDGSEDYDDDSPTAESYRYHDKDDNAVLSYGHAAGTAENRAIRTVVGRYYSAAAADDGATACSLILPSIARSMVEDYGQGAGPSYLRGGKTCQAVMSLLFRHFHGQLADAAVVTDVRVNGSQAQAFVGSPMMFAGSITVRLQSGTWWIEELLGMPLP